MDKRPWLSVIGLGEDGMEGLNEASRNALLASDVIMGPARHMALVAEGHAKRMIWPVPFANGIPRLLEMRGRKVAILASGDPFWFGSGSVIARYLEADEWQSFPGQSCFTLMSNRLGWALENTRCLGLHATPMSRLRPFLAMTQKLIVTLKDGQAVHDLAEYLCSQGFGASHLHIGQSLGGPRERVEYFSANSIEGKFEHPLCAAIDPVGAPNLHKASGLPDVLFQNDGQMTKRPIRALAMSALAPKPGETLWDIGSGSGSIAIEWLLCDPRLRAIAVERDPIRAERIQQNAYDFGVDHAIQITQGSVIEVLDQLDRPDVVFIGGGLSAVLLERLSAMLPPRTRIVAHAVTLESETILTHAQHRLGGTLLRIQLAEAGPLGKLRGWVASYPVVQWVATL